jgi:hypothetical protein
LPQSKPKYSSIWTRCESDDETDKNKCINYMNVRATFIKEGNVRVEILHIYCQMSQA